MGALKSAGFKVMGLLCVFKGPDDTKGCQAGTKLRLHQDRRGDNTH